MCSKRITRLGSNKRRWRYECNSSYMMLRHSVWGIEGYRLSTSIDTSMAESGTVCVSSESERDAELCR